MDDQNFPIVGPFRGRSGTKLIKPLQILRWDRGDLVLHGLVLESPSPVVGEKSEFAVSILDEHGTKYLVTSDRVVEIVGILDLSPFDGPFVKS